MTCCSNKKEKDLNFQNLKIKTSNITTLEFKIVLLGDLSVGKSSIANRYIKGNFSNKYIATIGGSFYAKNIKLKTY